MTPGRRLHPSRPLKLYLGFLAASVASFAFVAAHYDNPDDLPGILLVLVITCASIAIIGLLYLTGPDSNTTRAMFWTARAAAIALGMIFVGFSIGLEWTDADRAGLLSFAILVVVTIVFDIASDRRSRSNRNG